MEKLRIGREQVLGLRCGAHRCMKLQCCHEDGWQGATVGVAFTYTKRGLRWQGPVCRVATCAGGGGEEEWGERHPPEEVANAPAAGLRCCGVQWVSRGERL